jgi:hypothetical protein
LHSDRRYRSAFISFSWAKLFIVKQALGSRRRQVKRRLATYEVNMPFDALEYHKRRETIKTLADRHSLMAGSAFDYVDGAIWLIGGWRIPQALSLLHNAIELMLKKPSLNLFIALLSQIKAKVF